LQKQFDKLRKDESYLFNVTQKNDDAGKDPKLNNRNSNPEDKFAERK